MANRKGAAEYSQPPSFELQGNFTEH